jgi:hypothetical protein
MHRSKKRKLIVLALLALAAVSAVGGYAFWTSGGAGTGSAGVGTTSALVVNQTSVISGLVPGGPAQTLSGNFDNPSASAVFVTAVTATVTGSSAGVSCDATNFAIGGSAPVGASVASGTGKGSWGGLTISMIDKPTVNQDACKKATVNISYIAS